jgi:hypothetical protein
MREVSGKLHFWIWASVFQEGLYFLGDISGEMLGLATSL